MGDREAEGEPKQMDSKKPEKEAAEEEEEIHVPYGQRAEWHDVTPIPPNEGEHPVAAILYDPEFADTMSYFRAVVHANEMSQRALQLTQHALRLNSSNYTVWQFRRKLLDALKVDLTPEFALTEEIAEESAKNYQLWYHRQVIVQKSNDPSRELAFCGNVLAQDAKNYHAWAHRQWVMKTYNMWDQEEDYLDDLLIEDVRNNSAWNQRSFYFKYGPKKLADFRESEIDFTIEKLARTPNNESAWNYLRGLVQDEGYEKFPKVREFCEGLRRKDVLSPYLLAFMVELYIATKDTREAMSLCDLLMNNVDVIRKKYWSYRKDQLAPPS